MNNNQFPLISIIMLNYNGLKYLKRTVLPILKLSYPNYEFIIVDNGSTDDSIEFIKKFKKITLIKNEKNLGYSKGKNIGIKKADGKYVLLLDNDILIDPKIKLREIYNIYLKLKNPAFMNILLINQEDIKAGFSKQYGSYYGLSGIKENKPLKITYLRKFISPIETVLSFGGAMFIKKSIWEKLGGLDESQPFNLDDDDISLRARIYGYINYTYTQNYFIHLGQERRKDNKEYAWKYKYYFSGKLKPIIKNFEFRTMVFMIPLFLIVTIMKTFKQALFRCDPNIFYSFFYSIRLFFRDLSKTIKERVIIQKNRMIRDKELFKIKFPKDYL